MSEPAAAPASAAPLAGKTALVTGAATGIGRAIVGALAAAGANVVINHNHMPEPAGKVVAEITAGAQRSRPGQTSATGLSTRRWWNSC